MKTIQFPNSNYLKTYYKTLDEVTLRQEKIHNEQMLWKNLKIANFFKKIS